MTDSDEVKLLPSKEVCGNHLDRFPCACGASVPVECPRYKHDYATRPPVVTDEVVELRQKLRMIISHASGGALSKPGDIDRSVNDICVEISRHKNDIWEQAQKSARASMPAVVSGGQT